MTRPTETSVLLRTAGLPVGRVWPSTDHGVGVDGPNGPTSPTPSLGPTRDAGQATRPEADGPASANEPIELTVTRRRDHDWVMIGLTHVTEEDAAVAASGVVPPLEDPHEIRGPICFECETDYAEAGPSCD